MKFMMRLMIMVAMVPFLLGSVCLLGSYLDYLGSKKKSESEEKTQSHYLPASSDYERAQYSMKYATKDSYFSQLPTELKKEVLKFTIDQKLIIEAIDRAIHKNDYDLLDEIITSGTLPATIGTEGLIAYALLNVGDTAKPLIQLKPTIERLLKAGININYQDPDGDTALNLWIRKEYRRLKTYSTSGFIAMLKFLLENGANPTIANNEGKKPVDYVQEIYLSQGVRFNDFGTVRQMLNKAAARIEKKQQIGSLGTSLAPIPEEE